MTELEKQLVSCPLFILITLIVLEFTKPSLPRISICSCTLTTVYLMPGLDNIFTTLRIAYSQNSPIIS